MGLSPPTRGSPKPSDLGYDDGSSIPAHAGEPTKPVFVVTTTSVYPRPRGGALIRQRWDRVIEGLSPPTRGSPAAPHMLITDNGSIPAHAGEPSYSH